MLCVMCNLAILELKSMQFWLGQNFTYSYVHIFREE
jgi:hypothetical protein